MADDTVKIRIEADAGNAVKELDGVAGSVERVGDAATEASEPVKTFADRALEVRDQWQAAQVAMAQAERAIDGVAKGLVEAAEFAGIAGQKLEDFKRRMEDLPRNPFSAVVYGIRESINEFQRWQTEEEKVRLATALRIPLEEAESMTLAQLNERYEENIGKLRSRRAEIDKLSDSILGNADAMRRQSENLVQAVQEAEAAGNLSEQAIESISEKTQKLIDDYARASEQVPEALQKIADRYGVVSSAAEEAAVAAEKTAQKASEEAEKQAQREIEAAEKAAAKEEERAAREVAAHAKRMAAMAEAAAKKIETAEAEAAKADQQYQEAVDQFDALASQDTPEAVAKLKDELANLRDQDIITPQQLARMAELEDTIGNLTVGTGKLAIQQERLRIEDEAWLKVVEARNKAQEAEEARLDAYLDQARENTEATADLAGATEDAGGAAGDAALSFEELGRQNEENLRQFDNLGESAGEVGDSLGELGDAVGSVGESLDELSEKTDGKDTGFEKMSTQADDLIPKLEQIKGLVIEIRKEAASISLGV